jgi:hypothetical protein
MELDAAKLASIAGIVLSLLFSYIPGLNAKFAALESMYKRLIMAGLLLLTAAAIFGLSCAGYWPQVTCDRGGVLKLIEVFIAALIANQAAYAISPVAPAVQTAKAQISAQRFNEMFDEPLGRG